MLDEATLRCKSQLLSTCGSLGVFDPSNPEIWYESRFHRTVESEANLLGVVCTASGIVTAAPYRVVKTSHWVFAGTRLRNGDIFGTESLQERCHGGVLRAQNGQAGPSLAGKLHTAARRWSH